MRSSRIKQVKTTIIAVQLVTALACVSHSALADSPRSWGYWDAATAAGPGDAGNDGFATMTQSQQLGNVQNNNSGNGLNSEQNTTRLSNRLVQDNEDASVPAQQFIAYNICYYNCDGSGRQHIKPKKAVKTAGKMRVSVAESSDASRALISIKGSYDRIPVDINGADAYLRQGAVGPYSRTDLSAKLDGAYLNTTLSETFNGEAIRPFVFGNIGTFDSSGSFVMGQPITATQIASQLRLGQTYSFSGSSFYGSNVKITVNFQKARWNGKWSKIKKMHNGFKAAGNIVGSNLISTRVKGLGKSKKVGFVKGGKVDATLVGVINGKDASKAGVIGSAIVKVKQKKGSKVVGDIFAATAVSRK